MSLKALIDAAEYVDKGDNMTSEENQSTGEFSECPPLSALQRRLSGDGTITHWRKRAVAQSVLELQNKTDLPIAHPNKDTANDSHVSINGDALTNGDTHTSVRPEGFSHDRSLLRQYGAGSAEGLGTGDPYFQVQGSLPKQHMYRDLPDQQNSFHSTMINSEDAVTLSANAQPSSSPSSTLTKKSVAYSPCGSLVNKDTLPESPRLPHGYSTSAINRKDNFEDDSVWLDRHDRNSFDIPRKRHGSVTREAHNQLEKTRRRHLKECYERLRSSMPNLGPKTSHLTILREALKCIQILKQRSQELGNLRHSLSKEKFTMQERLQQLKDGLAKRMGPTEIDKLLLKASERASEMDTAHEVKHTDNEASARKDVVPASTQNSPLSPTIPKQTFVSYNGYVQVPASNMFPALSTTLNIANEARRLCTMLPTMRVLPSSAVQRTGVVSATNRVAAIPPHNQYLPSGNHNAHQIRTASVPSSYPNIRSYTGFRVPEGSTFMQNNPLKIVVKQVESAKQQARAARPVPFSAHEVAAKSPARSSLMTPKEARVHPSGDPSRSNIDRVFPGFRLHSAGSPPLLSRAKVTEDQRDGNDKKESVGDVRKQSRALYRRPRSKSDIEEAYDDPEMYIPPRKRKCDSSTETFSLKSWKALSHKRPDRNSFHGIADSLGHDVVRPRSVTEVPESTVDETESTSRSTSTATSQIKVPSTVVNLSALVNPTKSITQVSFTTLNGVKPAIPQVTSLALKNEETPAKSDGFPQNKAVMATGMMNCFPAYPGMMSRMAMPQNNIAMAQNMVPVMMPVMASPSMGFMMPAKSMEIYSSANTKPSVTVATQTISSTNHADSKQDIRSAQSGTYNTKAQSPQFQYMMPMAFPGMMAGSNCSPMMMQAPMGSFMPMMPQGQGWGFMMPQGMMMMPGNMSGQQNNNRGSATSQQANSQQEKSEARTVTTASTSAASSPQPASNSQTVSPSTSTNVQVQQQQFQMMAPGFQNSNQYMMPFPNGQGGGFYFGGAPAMMPAPGQTMGYPMPMNIIGVPMQFGGSNQYQFVFSGSHVNAHGRSNSLPSSSDESKSVASDSTSFATENQH